MNLPIFLQQLIDKADRATPGPWEMRRAKQPVDGELDYAIGADFNDQKYCIAETFGRADYSVTLPAEANANFIAAANPKVVKALAKVAQLAGRAAEHDCDEAIHPICWGNLRYALAHLNDVLKEQG